MGATPAAIVSAKALTKRFGARVAVDAVDFEVQAGTTFGFLGPNGAGKTSTMRMIACVSPLSAGELSIMGLDAETKGREIRARLGVVPQDDALDTELTVRENLYIYGRYFGIPRRVLRERVPELLDFAQLTSRSSDRVETLSGGMRRRLTVARALVNEPSILLLDEPTTGLDPQGRHLLWQRFWQLRREGVTILLTTHYMDEAEQLCDDLVIMDGGHIVGRGSPSSLIAAHSTAEVVELRFDRGGEQEAAPQAAEMAPRIEVLAGRILCYSDDAEATARSATKELAGATGFHVRRATLEDVFLHLTGRTLID